MWALHATIEKKATATISAKPQITNPKAEIARFVPTALRVRRENKGAAAAPQRKSEDDSAVPLAKTAPKSGPSVPVSVQTKDDVYEAFMKDGRAAVTALYARSGFCSHQLFMEKEALTQLR